VTPQVVIVQKAFSSLGEALLDPDQGLCPEPRWVLCLRLPLKVRAPPSPSVLPKSWPWIRQWQWIVLA